MRNPVFLLSAGLLLLALLLPRASAQSAVFNLSLLSASYPFEARVDSTIQPVLAPLAFTDATSRIGVAPAGSWLLYGTQEDVWLSMNSGASWSLLAGQPNASLPNADVQTWSQTGTGNSGCAHRSTFNRFYWMGVSNQNSGAVQTTGSFFNYVSVNGQEWAQIMDAASIAAMGARLANEFGICVVDKNERVYSVLGNDTWLSVNLGVSWSRVPSSSYYQQRQQHAGGIYLLPGSTQENIVILAGRQWSTASPYGQEMNDVWISTNYGLSWQQQTAAAPWYPRENPNVVISSQGLIAMNGGNLCGGYGCYGGGPPGPYTYVGWLSDAWCSFDNGVSWQQLAATTGSQFAQAATILDANGYWYTFAGQTGPANNTNYAWTNSGYKSTLSLTAISSWAGQAGLTIPGSWTGQANALPGLCPVLTSSSTASSSSGFNFSVISSSFPFEVRVDSTIQPVLAPLAFTDAQNAIGIAPAGSWILYGTQLDVWISTTAGSSWSLLAGQPATGLPAPDSNTWNQTGSGNSGCSHRTAFNRWYWMGVSNQNSGAVQTTGQFFNYVSSDGAEWTQIMDAASIAAMGARLANEFGMCVVDVKERVYSVLGNDTWTSTNLGVSWSAVTTSQYFPQRQQHSGGIYLLPGSSTQQENIVVLAGRLWSTASPYGQEMNDVWITTNYGQSWQQQTANAPWYPRENPNVVIALNGIIALNGGNLCGGYGCYPGSGALGPYTYVGWLSDSWASFDNGVSWQQLAATTGSQFAQAATILDANGYWYTFAGQTGPANNTNYAWTNSGYKSTLSLLSIASWAPQAGLTVPGSWTGVTITPPSVCSVNSSSSGGGPSPVGGVSSSGGSSPVVGVSSSGGAAPPQSPSSGSSGGAAAPPSSSSSSGLSRGAIAGIVIGSVAGALLLLCVLWLFLCGARRSKKDTDMQTTGKFDQVEESTTSASGATHQQTQEVEMA
jgi:hypothetical protein